MVNTVPKVSTLLNYTEELSLGFYLSNGGYDVWLTGSRGVHPTTHNTLTSNDRKFWDWSFDEMALFDTPAYIRYVNQYTKSRHIKYIGHSQGTVTGFALFSSCDDPKYPYICDGIGAIITATSTTSQI